MNERSNKFNLLIQVLLPFFVSFIFYLFNIKEDIKAVMRAWEMPDFYDIMKFYIWAYIILGILFSGILTTLSLLLGLPIRFVTKLNRFSFKHSSLFIWILLVGMLLFIVSYLSPFSSMKETKIFQSEELVLDPNFSMILIGSFLINFSVLHFCYLRLSKNRSSIN